MAVKQMSTQHENKTFHKSSKWVCQWQTDFLQTGVLNESATEKQANNSPKHMTLENLINTVPLSFVCCDILHNKGHPVKTFSIYQSKSTDKEPYSVFLILFSELSCHSQSLCSAGVQTNTNLNSYLVNKMHMMILLFMVINSP